ncbi:MAG: response regulator [Bacteroidota bacterium]|nr:response regulator [Bacteroidota bacterium]
MNGLKETGSIVENNIDNLTVKALIVEDEIDICFLLTGILRKKNLHTTFVNTIKDAQNTLTSLNPAILFLDNNLPDGFGVDLIYHIKKENPSIKIVMMTADDTIADKAKALKAGADAFIGKPFTRDTINKTVDKLITQYV